MAEILGGITRKPADNEGQTTLERFKGVMQLENLAERDRVLLKEKLRLQYETTHEQLQNVMAALESMLIENDRIDEEPLRVRFIGFGEYFLEVEVYAYTLTTDWSEFLEIREDILLKVMAIIEGSGTRLALPTEIRQLKGQDRPAGIS